MAKVKTSELQGAALDYAVAKCEGRTVRRDPMVFHDRSYWIWEETPSGLGGILIEKSIYLKIGGKYSPSTNWSQGGPIIEREGINIRAIRKPGHSQDGRWLAAYDHGNTGTMVQWVEREDWHKHYFVGETALIAAMRCYVASKLGDVVGIPDELVVV